MSFKYSMQRFLVTKRPESDTPQNIKFIFFTLEGVFFTFYLFNDKGGHLIFGHNSHVLALLRLIPLNFILTVTVS